MAAPAPPTSIASSSSSEPIRYRRYEGEGDIPKIMSLVDSELSEPYNWYTYRYFLQDWLVHSPIRLRAAHAQRQADLVSHRQTGHTYASSLTLATHR